jgi:hypothetical protein
MGLAKKRTKLGMAGIAAAAATLAATTAYAGGMVYWSLPAQGGAFKHPASDLSSWSNAYGQMTHLGTGTNELDFPIPAVQNWGVQSVTQLYGTVNGTNNGGAGTFCGQMLAVGENGSLAVDAYVCAPPNASSQELVLGQFAPPTSTPYFDSEFIAVWATGNVTINYVNYAFLGGAPVLGGG